MSKYIKLDTGKEIREWIVNHPPERETLTVKTQNEMIAEPPDSLEKDSNNDTSKDNVYFGVNHTICTNEGHPIVTLGRVYLVKDAEEALSRYIFDYGVHQSGKGVDCVYFKIRQYFWYELQEISVFRLADGTNNFL